MRRPPYSLWGDRDGEIAREKRADSCDEYLLWVDGRGSAHRAAGGGRPERCDEAPEQVGRAAERQEWFHPEGVEATRVTEPRRVWRFLPVGDERLREPALLGGPVGSGIGEGRLRAIWR